MRTLKLSLILTLTLAASGAIFGQMRSINSLDTQAQRPKANTAAKPAAKPLPPRRKKNISVIANRRRKYTSVAAKPVAPKINKPVAPINKNAAQTIDVGITFWRLRPANSDEADAPLFAVKIGDKTENWTAERVNSTTKFEKGDRVRFTVESPRNGFLYVVNREFYADGTTGEATLIYPTLRNSEAGDNAVVAGKLTQIPATGAYPYFNVNPRQANYAGEELIVIIAPTALKDIEISLKASAVKRDLLEKWLTDWATEAEVFDAEDGAGIAYTQNEADSVKSRALTQDEPLPQTIYRVATRPDQPLVVRFQMQVKTR